MRAARVAVYPRPARGSASRPERTPPRLPDPSRSALNVPSLAAGALAPTAAPGRVVPSDCPCCAHHARRCGRRTSGVLPPSSRRVGGSQRGPGDAQARTSSPCCARAILSPEQPRRRDQAGRPLRAGDRARRRAPHHEDAQSAVSGAPWAACQQLADRPARRRYQQRSLVRRASRSPLIDNPLDNPY